MKSVTIYPGAKIVGREQIEFGDHVLIDDYVFIYAKKRIQIGDYVHLAAYSSITGGEEVAMAPFSTLSWGCRLFTASDDFTGYGFGNSTVPEPYRNVRRAPVSLGRFAIVGANTVILPGVTIGEGASIGANSVVSCDLAPWGVYIGNRRVRDRDKASVLANFQRFCRETGYAG